MNRTITLIAILAISMLTMSAEAGISRAFYFVGGGHAKQFGGDFDGESAIAGGGSAEIMPDIDTETGWLLGFGWQGSRAGIELTYELTKSDGVWAGVEFPIDYRSYAVDVQIFLNRKPWVALRPLLTLGLAANRMKVIDGSTDLVNLRDAKFIGGEFRVGGGFQIRPVRLFALTVQAMYRLGWYTRVEGIVDGDLEDAVNSNGATLRASFSIFPGQL